MILSTHAIVSGALASLFPSHPVIIIAAGFASHFAIDAIPHWDYPLRSISVGPGPRRRLRLDGALLRDLALIGIDAEVGLALAVGLFATPATVATILLGASAAMLPDPLQVLHTLYPREPLNSWQRFHRWIHTKRQLHGSIGVVSQVLFGTLVVGIADMIR